jgi:hypothetical protein
MNKRIVYTMPDGHMEMIWPMEGARLVSHIFVDGEKITFGLLTYDQIRPIINKYKKQGAVIEVGYVESEDEFAKRIMAKDLPEFAMNAHICELEDLPGRTFRSAWKQDNDKIPALDVDKAKLIDPTFIGKPK